MCKLVGNLCVATAPPPLHNQFTGRGRGRVARIARVEKGAGGWAGPGWGACRPPHHISVCAQLFTPRSERVANGAHMDKGGGYMSKQEGREGTQSGAAQEEGECTPCEHRLQCTPPLQTREEIVAPCACGKQGVSTRGGVYKAGEVLRNDV